MVLTNPQKAEALAAFQLGMGPIQIAISMGVLYDDVYWYLNSQGLEAGRRGMDPIPGTISTGGGGSTSTIISSDHTVGITIIGSVFDLSINSAVFNTAIATAIATEISRANSAYDPLGSAATAQTVSELYTDTKINTEVSNRNTAISAAISTEISRANAAYDVLGSAATAQSTAESFATSAIATALTAYQPLSDKGQPSGYASLDAGGKIPSAQIPTIAFSHTYVVADQAAMLALAANVGDLAVRTDISETFVLSALPASTLVNWVQLLTSSAVTSVNGLTGDVALTLAVTDAGSAHHFLTSYNSTTGAFTDAQPSFSDISGTLSITSVTIPVVTKNADYALVAATDRIVIFTNTATATLPAGAPTGTTFRLKLVGSGLVLTVTPASGTIDGSANVILTANNSAIDVIWDGSAWQIF